MFESDTAVHVRFAVEDHYFHSLAAFIYIFLSWLPGSDFLIAAVLTIMTCGAIISTKLLILKVLSIKNLEMSESSVDIISFASNILMAFYIKKANSAHYIGYQCANMWHNSTYIFMRFFAITTVIYFIYVYERYKKGVAFKKWLCLTVLLSVTTGFKASFLTVFAPMLACLLLYDLITGTKFKYVFSLGSTVFIPIGVMYLQSLIMAGDTGSNGYAISPFTALSMRGDHPKITLVLSVLFPLVVGLTHIKDFYKDKLYFCTLIMWAFAFLEVFLFIETGDRNLDTNFMWGYSIALFFLFLVSAIKMYEDFSKNILKNVKLATTLFCGEILIYAWHVVSGLTYFVLLLSGVTYFV